MPHERAQRARETWIWIWTKSQALTDVDGKRSQRLSGSVKHKNAEASDRIAKMEITTLVGGELENLGVPHYLEPKGRPAKKRPSLYHDLTTLRS